MRPHPVGEQDQILTSSIVHSSTISLPHIQVIGPPYHFPVMLDLNTQPDNACQYHDRSQQEKAEYYTKW